jgi:threonine dehydrogenase-like Zn-dependent dehydrogenase
LRLAHLQGAEVLNDEKVDVLDALSEITGGRRPDACIEAVGMESHSAGIVGAYDKVKHTLMLETDRPQPLRQAILACRNGGTVSVRGVYGGFIDQIPFGPIMNRSITIKTGQAYVHRFMKPLLQRILDDQIDPSFVITHRMGLKDAPEGFEKFRSKKDGCIKVVMRPS